MRTFRLLLFFMSPKQPRNHSPLTAPKLDAVMYSVMQCETEVFGKEARTWEGMCNFTIGDRSPPTPHPPPGLFWSFGGLLRRGASLAPALPRARDDDSPLAEASAGRARTPKGFAGASPNEQTAAYASTSR